MALLMALLMRAVSMAERGSAGLSRHAARVAPAAPVSRMASLLILLLAAALGSSSSVTAGTPPRVEATASVRSIAVGDTFRLDLAITWDEGAQVKPFAVPDKIGDFVVKDVVERPAGSQGSTLTKTISLVLTTFETGPRTIPPISLVYIGGDGATGTVETLPVEIEVRSLLGEDANDLRDIKRPLEVPKRWKDIVLSYLLIVGLAAGAAASLLVSFKRREEIEARLRIIWLRIYGPLRRLIVRLLVLLRLRPPTEIAAFDIRADEPGLVPSEAALRELGRIEALRLAQRGMIKELYTLVSETLRRYLERQYGVLAMESPTSYTLAALGEARLSEPALLGIQEVLVEADWVKFAKHVPAASAVGSLVGRSRDVVHLTARESEARESESGASESRPAGSGEGYGEGRGRGHGEGSAGDSGNIPGTGPREIPRPEALDSGGRAS